MQLKITDAATEVGVSPQTIRKWERQGLVHCPRSSNGFRYFMAQDIERLRLIKDLLGRGTRMATVRRLIGEIEGKVGSRAVPLCRTLNALRLSRGWTVADVAKRIAVSEAKVYALENGHSNGTIEILQRLATSI